METDSLYSEVVGVTGFGLRHLGSNSCPAFNPIYVLRLLGKLSKMPDVEFSTHRRSSVDSAAIAGEFPGNWGKKGISSKES